MLNSAEWDLGERGQRAWESWLRQHGWSFVRLSHVNDGRGAPLSDGRRVIVLPDLAAFRVGRHVHVECKAKSSPVEQRVRAALRHGIEQRKHREYLAYEEATGCDLLMAFWEENHPASLRADVQAGRLSPSLAIDLKPDTLLCAWLHAVPWQAGLPGHEKHFGEPMVFVDRARLSPPEAIVRHPPLRQMNLEFVP